MRNYNYVLLCTVCPPRWFIHLCVCRAERKDLPLCLTLVAFYSHSMTNYKKSAGEFGILNFWFCWRPPGSYRWVVLRPGWLLGFAVWILWHSWAQISCPLWALNTAHFFLFLMWNSLLLEALGIVLQGAPQEELKPQNRMFWVGKQKNLTCFAVLKL